MKKIIAAALSALFLVGQPVFAQADKMHDLKFSPVRGGKFIYCNNIEELKSADLADDPENPVYIMNNENLSPDRYVMYVSHFNRIVKNIYGSEYPGEDIYIDAVFFAKEDTEILLSRTAFDVPKNNFTYLNYETIQTEESWSAIQAYADMSGDVIKTLNSNKTYYPKQQKPEKFLLKKGERVFLSRYIENFSAVAYPKHLLMAADFEILSGKADVNIFAARKRSISENGEISYPTVDFENCRFGSYKRDRTQKGIADSLPAVSASLEYTIDDTLADGKFLPVTVYNRYIPTGNNCLAWNTNINPQETAFRRNLIAESDLLSFKYRDPNKISYYGKNVPDNEKDDIWIFDTSHSDTAEYDPALNIAEDDYKPNYPLSNSENNSGYACNLGNYCVTTQYRLKVINNSARDRYFDYIVSSAANIIVKATDKDGTLLQTVVSKGQTNTNTTDTMASIRLAAGETTEFVLEMTLPVQNYGGQYNQFQINAAKTEPTFDENAESDRITPILIDNSKGLAAEIDAKLENANEKTKAIFCGNESNMYVVATDWGYAAYNKTISGNPYLYSYYWGITGKIYLLDKNFNITKELYLGSQPIEMTSANGKIYIKTIENGSFSIDSNGQTAPRPGYILPRDNQSGRAVRISDGKITVSTDGKISFPVAFSGTVPPFVECSSKLYYYAEGKRFGISADGVYWRHAVLDTNISSLSASDTSLTANGENTLFAYSQNTPLVLLNDEFLGFDTPPQIRDGELFIPMRMVFEKLGMQIFRDNDTKAVTAVGRGRFITLTPESDTAAVNGVEIRLSSVPFESGGRMFMPISVLSNMNLSIDDITEEKVRKITAEIESGFGDIECGAKVDVLLENGMVKLTAK
ncbi:MAG: copper amine oxidase N-terminal domain-containing protein [Firmicutes bacterium]|nr:copper amine oxidase N-terminal domain-containing protein [Bacillota bacterium]